MDEFHRDRSSKDGRRSECRECSNKWRREHYDKEKERAYAIAHREEAKESSRRYRERHPEKAKEYYARKKESGELQEYLERTKEQRKQRNKRCYKENRERIIKRTDDWIAEKRKTDPMFKFKCQIRGNIYDAFRRYSGKKPTNTKNIVGLELDEFRDYLLQTFVDNYGYEWDGKEPVHIDHIIPLSTAETEEDIMKLCHYTNLQLLKPEDNISKSDNLNWNLSDNTYLLGDK